MELTQDIVPNWLIATPDSNVAVGHLCEPFKVEMVIRGYISGHAAREYAAEKRKIFGVRMKEGLKGNDKFLEPIIRLQMDFKDKKDNKFRIGPTNISKPFLKDISNYTRKFFMENS